MQNLNKKIKLIILIAIIIFINRIDFGIKNGYFKADIDIFQTNVDVYSKYAAGVFVFISFLFLYLKNKNEPKSKNPNIISPEFLKHTPIILFIALIIYFYFAESVTDFSLIINKQKQISSVEREFKIAFFNDKKGELGITEDIYNVDLGAIVEQLEFYKMNKEIYNSLDDKKNIKMKFKTGLLGIPFEPEFEK